MKNDCLLRACRMEHTDFTPVWMMRQAGRYIPEYRKLRKKHDIISICRDPELSSEVALMPIERLEVDAAVLFSDITMILYATNIEFELKDNVGPVIPNPIRTAGQVKKIALKGVRENVWFVMESAKRIKKAAGVPVIGFSAAPFTLASYLVEGGATRRFENVRGFMHNNPAAWHALMGKLSALVLEYLTEQVRAGVDVVQLFDSWVGCLDAKEYDTYVSKYTKRIFSGLEKTGVPTIHFGTDTSRILTRMMRAGGDVASVDWRIGLDKAWSMLDYKVGMQGNLDPVVLLGSKAAIRRGATGILDSVAGHSGHIFNLGHGVLPDTPLENARYLVDVVHGYGRR